MKSRTLLFTLLGTWLLFGGTSSGQQPAGTSNIEGIVVRAGTGLPIAGAQVTLAMDYGLVFEGGAEVPPDVVTLPVIPDGPPQFSGPPMPPSVRTDAQGRFSFPSVQAGNYRLRVAANGHVQQFYGQRQGAGGATSIKVAEGQTISDISVALTPAGNISGRIRDEDQRPVPGVSVQLMRASYNENGQRHIYPVGLARTNDRGEYRIYWVTPGRYYLKAGDSAGGNALLNMMKMGVGGPGTVNPNEVPADAGVAYFPGVKDFGAARPIEVSSSGDLSGIDWTIPKPSQTWRVRARFVDAGTGKQPPFADAMIFPSTAGFATDPASPFGLAGAFDFGPPYNPETGIAEFRDLTPGTYTVYAIVTAFSDVEGFDAGLEKRFAVGREFLPTPAIDPPDLPPGVEPEFPGGPPQGMPPMPAVSIGVATVTVSDSDVDDVVITIGPSGSIQGHVEREGEIRAQSLALQLRPIGANFGFDVSGGQSHIPVEADGSFRIASLPPGEYRISATGLPSNAYVKAARLDGVDVLNAPLVSRTGASSVLEVVVSERGGKIQGVIQDERGTPVPAAQVVLVPDRSRERTDLYVTTSTDGSGRFTMAGIPPGSYKVFSWESMEQYGWFDPAIIERAESKASPVSIAEGTTENVEAQIISQRSAQ